MLKTYECKDYRVIINYHTQRSNLKKIYRASGNTEEVAKRLSLGTLLLEENKRYIKVDKVEVEEVTKSILDEWLEEE